MAIVRAGSRLVEKTSLVTPVRVRFGAFVGFWDWR